MTKRMIIMLIIVGLLFGGIFGFQAFKGSMIKKYMASAGNPPQTVSSIKATVEDWQPQIEAVGSLRAFRGADLSSEVAGIVEEIKFESGAEVKADSVLVQLRAEDDIAKLESLKAAAGLAGITYKRDQAQFAAKAIAQAVVDTDAANLKSANAQVAQQAALVAKKTIRAPFAGRLGIRAVDIGQYLQPGTKVVTLQSLDPIFVDFSLPQQSLSQIKVGQTLVALSDAYPNEKFSGEIAAINPVVDAATRNVQVRATLKNDQLKLLPGMFATVDIASGAANHNITLPQTAITYNPYGNTVYLVNHDGKDDKGKDKFVAKQVFVNTGGTRGDQVTVLDGVKEGDEVVTSGQVKLRNGSTILINNSITPSNNPNAQPKDN
ncbi:efflux RND transporter periplasmic adaptor subunit [Pseudolysobacter antarcticus]|uniref:Efflux RND transporter periplasmic adaptor subunit n=1 Tax=Pseudolysobacter antarcticus TaxID=2511995 RepID=A0A411HLH1_9GAMM|nr:efflux RND transporter periplasmic adaptor subunit [Pseudolysobacter antarcticus]QBB71250.1 efflux RND transporter periplasmic adaptor subunit [Pseudolysobacter antarcticus]